MSEPDKYYELLLVDAEQSDWVVALFHALLIDANGIYPERNACEPVAVPQKRPQVLSDRKCLAVHINSHLRASIASCIKEGMIFLVLGRNLSKLAEYQAAIVLAFDLQESHRFGGQVGVSYENAGNAGAHFGGSLRFLSATGR